MRAAAVILAAGRGERLGGAAKAALRLPDGRSFLEAIAAAARGAGCRRLVVVVAEPHLAATRAIAQAAGCDVVENPRPERGMLSSLVAGLSTLVPSDIDVALSWPVDHPQVTSATVASLLAAASRSGIAIPTFQGRGGHPTAFGADLWSELAAAIELSGGARQVVASDPGRVRRVPAETAAVVTDVDTPADLVGLP